MFCSTTDSLGMSASNTSSLLRPSAPSPAEWPSPGLSRIVTEPVFNSPVSPAAIRTSRRVGLFTAVGELLDANLLAESEVASLLDLAFRGEKETAQLADLVESRPSGSGKAQFLRIYLSISGYNVSGFTTPVPMHPTPFVDLPSPLVRSASPPMRFPLAVRPVPACPKLACIQEDLVRMQSVEEDPKLSPGSTNVGSSIDSTVSPPGAAPAVA